MNSAKQVIVVAGPTASGKTGLALRLAEELPIEIINADSLQLFRYLNIGTAKPSAQQREMVPHHLFDVLDPGEKVSAAWYARQASQAIDDIVARGHVPVLVGGTGFYLKALEYPPPELPSGPPKLPLPSLQECYQVVATQDPAAAAKIHANDAYRVQRAYQLIQQGILPSHAWRQAQQAPARYDMCWFAIDWPRTSLHQRIESRVDAMYLAGLIEETERLLGEFPSCYRQLERTIGYQDCLAHLHEAMSLTQAIESTKAKTRQYAKRQLTWFRKETRIQWLSPQDCDEIAVLVRTGSCP